METTPERSLKITLAALLSITAAHLGVQAHLIPAMVCPARDGARYVQYALRLEEAREPLAVIRSSDDHPGYPLLLFAALRAGKLVGIDSPANRLRLAQLATSISGWLLAITAYFVCRRLWGALPAWVAAFSLVTLARPAQTFADILSDAPHALFWSAALLCVLHGLDLGRPRWFALAGLLGSLAYWVRIDAVTLVAAVIGACGFLAIRRKLTTGLALRFAGSFLATHAAGLAGFWLVCNRLSTKPVGLKFLFGDAMHAAEWPILAIAEPLWPGRLASAIGHYANDLGQEVQFVHLATAGLALLPWLRKRSWRGLSSSAIFTAVVFAVYSALILAVDLRYGYLAGRYFLALVPLLAGFGANGLLRAFPGRTAAVSIGIVVASLAASAPSVLKRQIHDQTQGQLEAGRWVAGRIQPQERVFDPYFFPTYLAGIRDSSTHSTQFREAADAKQVQYFIVERSDLDRHSELKKLIDDGKATLAVSFPRRPGGIDAQVAVYRSQP